MDIWKEVLELEKISVTDDFFDLGGHSIKIIKLLHKLTSEFNIEVNFKNIFKYPTIESLASQISVAKKQKEFVKSRKDLNEIEI